jgi:hypothetical protein
MEWALRWFDTLDDCALVARTWWTRGRLATRVAALVAVTLLAILLLP